MLRNRTTSLAELKDNPRQNRRRPTSLARKLLGIFRNELPPPRDTMGGGDIDTAVKDRSLACRRTGSFGELGPRSPNPSLGRLLVKPLGISAYRCELLGGASALRGDYHLKRKSRIRKEPDE